MTNLLELKSVTVNERHLDNRARFRYQLSGKGIVQPTIAITGAIDFVVPLTSDLATAQKEVHDNLPYLAYRFGEQGEYGPLELNTVTFNERSLVGVARFRYRVNDECIISETKTISITGDIEIAVPWAGDLAIAQNEVDDNLRQIARE